MNLSQKLSFHSIRKSLLIALAFGVFMTGLIMAMFVRSSDGSENAERLVLYWSRYVSLILDSGASPQQLEKQLKEDAAVFPVEGGFRLIVQNNTGETIASYSGLKKQMRTLHQASKPYLFGGTLGGNVVIESASVTAPAIWPRALLAGGAAVLFASLGVWLVQRSNRRRFGYWSGRAGQLSHQPELHQMESGINTTSGGGVGIGAGTAKLNSLLPEEKQLAAGLDEAAALIRQLQTARKTMVAEVAHELRTPLSVVRAALDNALYESRPLPPERLATLSEQVGSMSRLVQDLQDLTLSESGSLRLEKSWFQPAAVATAILELLEPEAEEKGISVTAFLDTEARLFGDENRISQLLLNLLGNALRHARSQVELSVRVSGAMLKISVGDDGWGLEVEETEQLFQRYYRKRTYADGSPAPRGVGLGLAVVKGIAEAHGGTSAVSSRFGEGALFTVNLPLFRE
ncbi:Signal transduction histidine kinase [Paenibacillaceae bacterium GAS479]|nr:Signal transduction histidine kinase [Paenibacillaceae bacterium GAS479]